MNRTEHAVRAVSKAVHEATWAFERAMLEVKIDDLPTPVIAWGARALPDRLDA